MTWTLRYYFVKAQRHNHTEEDMVFGPIFICKAKTGLEIAKPEGFVAVRLKICKPGERKLFRVAFTFLLVGGQNGK